MLLVRQQAGSAAGYLAGVISGQLTAGKRLLWFLSGGSSIPIAISARRLLDGLELKNLTVMLVDERYGPDDHPDSNWRQLKDAGFDFSGLTAIPVLRGLSQEESANKFAKDLTEQLAASDYRLGLAGIGADGHTAGILPGSPALGAEGLVATYKGPDYQRITTTPKALAEFDEAIVSLSEEKKRPIVEKLQEDIEPSIMPAQLLKKLPRFIVFNDWTGEKL